MINFLLLWIWMIEAVPLHEVNKHDLSGAKCGLLPGRGVPCLPLCVYDLASCPLKLKPVCSSGLVFCEDGSCRTNCLNVVNVCSCTHGIGGDGARACKTEMTVNVKEYNKTIKSELIRNQCSLELGLELLPLWKPDWIVPETDYWAVCNVLPSRFTYTEPLFVSLFSICIVEFNLLLLWWGYKMLRERGVSRIMAAESSYGSEKMTEFVVKGYRNDLLGSFTLLTLALLTLSFFVYLSLITADYYGSVTGVEYGLTKNSFDLSSQVFIGLWTFTTIWLVGLNIWRRKLRCLFRIEVSALEGQWIVVEKQQSTLILLDDNSRSLKLVQQFESVLKKLLGWDRIVTICKLEVTDKNVKYFNYQSTRYVYSTDSGVDEKETVSGRFVPYDFNLGTTFKELKLHSTGLSTSEAGHRLSLKGPNFIPVKVDPFLIALGVEFSSFFYIYQMMIMWIFYYFAYYQVGLVDTFVIIISAIVKVVVRLKGEKRIKQMAEHESLVDVKRDEQWMTVSSSDLVPGDVIEITMNIIMPVDAIVLSGTIVADESSLTGEPLPVRKFAIRDEKVVYSRTGAGKVNSLFSGTKIVQATPSTSLKGEKVTALVYQTSTSTDKGQLIKNILYPSSTSFIFDEQLKLVITILGLWGLVLFSLSLWLQQKSGTASWFYGMLCLSQILSPLLPAALVVGQSIAANRLRGLGVYCVDLKRIVVAGKIRIFAFDKTGTLTKEGLEFYGVVPIIDSAEDVVLLKNGEESRLGEIKLFAKTSHLFQLGISTCHSVSSISGTLIGNPVDIEMFSSTSSILANEFWELGFVDSIRLSGGDKVVHIIKRFDFVHARASMSVAVLDTETNRVHIFLKGSFEKLKTLVNPSSIPSNYDYEATKLAMEGCYVLGMAHKDLGPISPELVKKMSREELEEGVDIMGLVVFKNKLKEDTKHSISQLKTGSTRTIMITGDTVLTGVYIARQCAMIDTQANVYLAMCDDNTIEEERKSIKSDIDEGSVWVYGLKWLDISTYHSKNRKYISTETLLSLLDSNTSDIELAVSNKEFHLLLSTNLITSLLLHIRIFARMGPVDKVSIIQLHMKRGITAMCGDGGNDCGALRAAHVGLALSEAEASIVSPFSSPTKSISSCVSLVREGRAALSSSFAGYKYLIMYGEVMASLKICTFYFSISLSNGIWIFIDAFITVALSFCVTQSGSSRVLANTRPTTRLLGPETLLSVLGQIGINSMFLIGAYSMLYQQDFFRCNEFDPTIVDITKWYLLGDNYESQTLAFVTLYQFINAAAIYNFGYKFRASFFRNWLLVFVWSLLLAVVSAVLLMDPNFLGCLLRLNCGDIDALSDIGYSPPIGTHMPYNIPSGHNVYPRYFRYYLFGYCIANMLVGLGWERLVVLGPVRNWARKRWPLKRLKLKY